MNDLGRVTIYSQPPYTKIFADGEEICGVRRFSIEQEVGMELPILKLELLPREIEFNGLAVREIEKPSP